MQRALEYMPQFANIDGPQSKSHTSGSGSPDAEEINSFSIFKYNEEESAGRGHSKARMSMLYCTVYAPI